MKEKNREKIEIEEEIKKVLEEGFDISNENGNIEEDEDIEEDFDIEEDIEKDKEEDIGEGIDISELIESIQTGESEEKTETISNIHEIKAKHYIYMYITLYKSVIAPFIISLILKKDLKTVYETYSKIPIKIRKESLNQVSHFLAEVLRKYETSFSNPLLDFLLMFINMNLITTNQIIAAYMYYEKNERQSKGRPKEFIIEF